VGNRRAPPMPKAAGDCNNRTTAAANRRLGLSVLRSRGRPGRNRTEPPAPRCGLRNTDSGSGRTGQVALRTRRLAAERARRHRQPFGRAKATIAHSTYQRLQKS